MKNDVYRRLYACNDGFRLQLREQNKASCECCSWRWHKNSCSLLLLGSGVVAQRHQRYSSLEVSARFLFMDF